VATTRYRDSALNKATADYLRGIKGELALTYDDIARDTSIGLEQVKKLLNNRASIKLTDFVELCRYFDLNAEATMQTILDKVRAQK
jgi:hypothetical protein